MTDQGRKFLSDILQAIELKDARRIAGFRNRLIHTYDTVDPSIIWAIINNHLKPLKKEVQNRLN